MKKVLHKLDKYYLGHKLHQLQKRYKRARLNGKVSKMNDYKRRIKELQYKLLKIDPK